MLCSGLHVEACSALLKREFVKVRLLITSYLYISISVFTHSTPREQPQFNTVAFYKHLFINYNEIFLQQK
jgi:hypothetical protein